MVKGELPLGKTIFFDDAADYDSDVNLHTIKKYIDPLDINKRVMRELFSYFFPEELTLETIIQITDYLEQNTDVPLYLNRYANYLSRLSVCINLYTLEKFIGEGLGLYINYYAEYYKSRGVTRITFIYYLHDTVGLIRSAKEFYHKVGSVEEEEAKLITLYGLFKTIT